MCTFISLEIHESSIKLIKKNIKVKKENKIMENSDFLLGFKDFQFWDKFSFL